MMYRKLSLLAGLVAILILIVPANSQTMYDITVGTDKLVYGVGDTATISGYVKQSTDQPGSGVPVNVIIAYDNNQIYSDSTTTSSTGSYQFTQIPVNDSGTYDIQVTTEAGTGVAYGSFKAESKKKYILTTDSYVYSISDTVNLNLEVESVNQDGSTSPAEGVSVPLKIKLENGTVLKTVTLTSDSNGEASTSYVIQNYGKYVAVIGNGLAIAKFEAPPFDVKLDTITSEGKSKYLFGTSDNLVLKAVATVDTDNGAIPVKGATILATLKDSAGNIENMNFTFTETSDGVYESNSLSLSDFGNGEYFAEVKVTKGSTQKMKAEFEIQSYNVELEPISGSENTFGFLKGSEARLGIIIEDMSSGEELTGDKIINATITKCRNSDWEECSVNSQLEDGIKDFSKVLNFTAPNEVEEYYFKVSINISTTSGTVNVIGERWVSVQSIIASVESKDTFDNWRWKYGPGETVVLQVEAIGSGWTEITNNINSITIQEVRDENWNIVTSNITGVSYSDNEVQFSAPEDSGRYQVKLKVTLNDGSIAYTGTDFEVSLYDIWAETKKLDENDNWQWEWRFGTDSDVYLHVNVRELGGEILPANEIAKISVPTLRNEVTGKEYSNLKVNESFGTATNPDGDQVPVVNLSLDGMGLSSGFYNAEIEVTDIEGNKESGGAWFKVSNLDVLTQTKKSSGEISWQFGPSENVTIDVTANYFNMTAIPNGSTVSITKLLSMRRGPPTVISSSKYNTSGPNTTTNGEASLWLKPLGDPLPEGHYMALVKVVADDSQSTTELAEAWFDVKIMQIRTSMEQFSYSQSQNVSISITAKKSDETPISNVNVTLDELRDTQNWRELDLDNLGISASGTTGSQGKVTLNFPASSLETGDYEARIEAESGNLNSKTDDFVWFSVQNYKVEGWYVTDPGREYGVYAPDEEVTMQVKVMHPNSTWDQEYYVQNANVSIYEIVNIESMPWTYKEASMVSSTPTSMPGVYQVKFKAPQESGKYHPLVNISGDESKTPWQLPEFTVRDLSVSMSMFRSGEKTDEFMPGDTISTMVNISNPTGNELPTITEVKLDYYKDLRTEEKTTLGGKITSNIDESNSLTFTAPDSEGEYILTVSVKTSNKTIYAKKWFRVSAFDMEAWTEKWSYSPGEDVGVNIKTYSSGGALDLNVTTLSVKNVWESSYSTYDEQGVNRQTISSGEGMYNLTAPQDVGEYEAELCAYRTDPGTLCENGKMINVHFSVESFRIDTWPANGGSFTTGSDVVLNVELRNADGSRIDVNNYDVTLSGLVKARTEEDASSSMGNVTYGSEEGDLRKTVSFSAENLEETDYEAILNITKDGESRMWRAWFKVSGYEILLQTKPPEYSPWEHPFPVNENITFNVTLNPAPSEDTSGTFYIKNCKKNWNDAIDPVSFDLVNGTALINVSLNEVGEYDAFAQVETAEKHYWFRVSAFEFNVNHDQSTHEIKPEDDVTVAFTLLNRTGQAEYSSADIEVTRVQRARDWSTVSENVFSDNVSLDANGKGSFTFSPKAGSLDGGEYEAQLDIEVNGKTQREFFWFEVRTIKFDAWHEESFLPGEQISIDVELRYPNGTAIEGREITVEEVYSENRGVINNYNSTSDTTESNGRATVTLNLSKEVSGWVDVGLKESKNSEIRWVGFSINGYKLDVQRNWEKWSFSTTENYTADLYVYDSEGQASANNTVEIEVYKEGNWETDCYNATMDDTDSRGHSEINFSCDELDGTSHYELKIIVSDGAAIKRDWFKVESYHVDAWAQGSSSGREELTPSENVRIMVKVEEIGTRNAISGANVSLEELHKVPEWSSMEFPNITKNNQTTDSNGFAELVFAAPPEGEYEVEVNVSDPTYGTNTGYAWFRVTSTLINTRMLCPIINGSVTSCRDPYTKSADGPVNIMVEGTGELKVVLRAIQDFWRDQKTTYNVTAIGSNGTILNFIAPGQEGDYEAIFDIYVKKDGNWVHRSEKREWFEVASSSGLMAHTWVDPQNVWAGKNATVGIFVEDYETWEPVRCEEGSSMRIVEIKDSWDWTTEVSGENIQQWFSPPSEMGPEESRITFKVPDLDTGREYAALVNITCVHDGVTENLGTKEAWFRVAAFQVSSLMNEFQKMNETVSYWAKVTDANGTPIQNATVHQNMLVGEPNWEPIETWEDVNYTTDEHGEIMGSFQTPSYPGEFELTYTVVNGSSTQKMHRWFQIQGLDVKLELNDSKFYNDENISITVNVTDAVSDLPVQDATVRLSVMPMMEGPEEEENETDDNFSEPEENAEEIFFPETLTSPNGTAQFNIPAVNTTSTEYMVQADVCTDDKGCVWTEKRFKVRNFNITTTLGKEYQPGDNITISIQGKDKNGTALANAPVFAHLMDMSMESGNMSIMDNVTTMLNGTGETSFDLTIPTNFSGMSIVRIRVNHSGIFDDEGYLTVVHQTGVEINVNASETASPGEFMDVNINSTNEDLAIAPMVMQMERMGTSVSMSQMMGGQKSENWYESPVYLRKDDQDSHIKIQAKEQPGSYTAVIMFVEEGTSWYGPENMNDVIFMDYEVVQ